MDKSDLLCILVEMSQKLGRPERELVIMGEGNTSARINEKTFFVKASGTQLQGIGPDGFVEVALAKVLAISVAESREDGEVKAMLSDSRVNPSETRQPSVETMFHAILYDMTGAQFIGHTHPISVNSVICSQDGLTLLSGRTTPEEVVYLGPDSVVIPYADPGLPLARAVRKGVTEYLEKWGEDPKVIFLQNHGVFALGKSAQAVENTQAMADKAAWILLGTMQFGGPHFLSEKDVLRIHTRPDEVYRRKVANQG